MQGQGIVKGDTLQQIAGIGFIVGAVLTLIGNGLFPRADDPADTKASLEAIATFGTASFPGLALVLAGGFWGLMLGFIGVYPSLSAGPAAAFARIGFYGVLIGVALWTITFAVHLGLAQVLDSWAVASGPDKAALFQAASSIWQMDAGIFTMAIIVVWLASPPSGPW